MTMLDTSLESWQRLQPELQSKRDLVLSVITASEDGMTCRQVEEASALSHQSASARIKELLDMGKIAILGTALDFKSQRTVRVYGVRY